MMESYQSSDLESQEQAIRPFKAAAIAGGSLLGGTSLLARAMPFLSRYIAQPTAIKALSKLSPKMEKFIKNGMGAGYTFDEVRNFLEKEYEEEQQPKQPENAQEAMQMQMAKARSRQPSDLSRESLMQQQGMGAGQQGQGKEALLSTMQQITQALRQMRGQGG